MRIGIRGVQNPDRGGANAPPSPFLKALSRAVSEAYSLSDRQGVQGGSPLFCIKISGKREFVYGMLSTLVQYLQEHIGGLMEEVWAR